MTVHVDPVPAELLAPAAGDRADFLLELRSEEIPARMQDRAREDLRWAFETEIRQEGSLHQGSITTYATPRRLVLIARGLAAATEFEIEEFKGPKVGAPETAVEGFLKKVGASRDELFDRADTKGTLTYYVQRQKPSRATVDVLAAILPRIIRAFPWPKSMRWGEASRSTESLRWVRPLHGIVALFGEQVVPVAIAGVTSGATTLGHRFHHPGSITIGSATDYVEKLRACHVVVDQDERRAHIRDRATALAAEAGLTLVEDEGLVAENAGLTEWPVPLLGRFDSAFLDVPPEVIQLTARVNQKYFVCRAAVEGEGGKLADAFVCTANIDATDGGATIVEGNRKVLAARLSDARFFYDTDLKVPLEEQAKKLDRIVFHEKLGTVADKVERVAKLARWLVESDVVTTAQAGVAQDGETPASAGVTKEDLATLAERAARLAKADLVTGMVGEFPELQGLMGGYYAAAQGEDPQVAAAVRDHYKPVGQGDEVPTAPVTVAVSLADKLDTIAAFFALDEKPTGSKDPFALRRAALGVINTVQVNNLRIPLLHALGQACSWVLVLQIATDAKLQIDPVRAIVRRRLGLHDQRLNLSYVDALPEDILAATEDQLSRYQTNQRGTLDFFADRLKVQQREAGVRHDLIDAVFAAKGPDGAGEDDLVRLLARVRALQAFVGTEDGANLLTGYRRAANILKKEGYVSPTAVTPAEAGIQMPDAGDGDQSSASLDSRLRGNDVKGLSYKPEKDEAALLTALDSAEPRAAHAVAAEDFEGAMAALASLRSAVDAFFDSVTVNDPDAAKRVARLALLARVRDAVHTVADFSRIEG